MSKHPTLTLNITLILIEAPTTSTTRLEDHTEDKNESQKAGSPPTGESSIAIAATKTTNPVPKQQARPANVPNSKTEESLDGDEDLERSTAAASGFIGVAESRGRWQAKVLPQSLFPI